MERAAKRDRAKITARYRRLSKEEGNDDEKFVVIEEEEEEESIQQANEVVDEEGFVEEEEVVEDEQGSGEVEKRFYSQLELSDMEASKRGLLNWVMQMEYAGQTFFDGYVPLFFFFLRSMSNLHAFVGVVASSCVSLESQ